MSQYNATCRKCGWPGYQGIGPIKCSNGTCTEAETPGQTVLAPGTLEASRTLTIDPGQLKPGEILTISTDNGVDIIIDEVSDVDVQQIYLQTKKLIEKRIGFLASVNNG